VGPDVGAEKQAHLGELGSEVADIVLGPLGAFRVADEGGVHRLEPGEDIDDPEVVQVVRIPLAFVFEPVDEVQSLEFLESSVDAGACVTLH
jgi:hypothetical protein